MLKCLHVCVQKLEASSCALFSKKIVLQYEGGGLNEVNAKNVDVAGGKKVSPDRSNEIKLS